jgi:translocation and assembly module TamB
MRIGRASAWTVSIVAILALIVVATVTYVGSRDFLERLASMAVASSDGRLALDGLDGSVYREVRVGRIDWRDGETAVRLDDSVLRFSLAPLLVGRLHVSTLSVGRLAIETGPGTGEPFRLPESIALPMRVAIDDLWVRELIVATAPGDEPFKADGLRAGMGYDGERFHLRNLVVGTPYGALAATLSVADESPHDIEGVARLTTTLAVEPMVLDLRAYGTPSLLKLEVRGALRDASAQAVLELAPFDDRPIASLVADLAGVDLARFVEGLPQTRLDGRIEAHSPDDSNGWLPLAGTFRIANPDPGTIDAQRLPIATATGAFSLSAQRLSIRELVATGPAGTLDGSLDVRLDDASYQLRLATEALDLRRVHPQLVSTRLRGSVELAPQGEGVAVRADLTESGRQLEARAHLQATQLTIESATLRAAEGSASFGGQVQVAAPYRFRLAGSAQNIDPARFADVPSGRLSGAWQASGVVQPKLEVTAGVTLTDSRWRGLPVSGRAQGIVMGTERVRDVKLTGRLGANTIEAAGSLGAPGDRMTVNLDAQRLRELDERLAGRLRVEGELRNRLDRPAFAGKIRGDELGYLDRVRIGLLQATASLPDTEQGAFAVDGTAARLVVDGRALDRVALETVGRLDRHGIALRASSKAEGVDAQLRAEGNLTLDAGWRWQGRVLEARQSGTVPLALMAPADVVLAPGEVSLRQVRLQVDGPQGGTVELERASLSGAMVALQGTASRLPLRWLAAAVPIEGLRANDDQALRVGARMNVAGSLEDATMKGDILVFRESGDLRIDVPTADGGTEPLAAGASRTDLRIEFDGDRIAASMDLRGDTLGSVQLRARSRLVWVAARQRPDLDVPLEGGVDLDVPSLAWTRPLAGEAWRFDGRLRARLSLGGTVGAPKASGEVTGSALVAEQREIGMRLTNGELVASLRENLVEIRTLRFASGEGSVQMQGALRAGDNERSDAVITLTRMPIPLGPGQRLVLTGETTAQLSRGTLRLQGKLRADEGVIELSGNDAPRLARDIVVVRREGEPPLRIGNERVADTVAAARRQQPGVTTQPGAAAKVPSPNARAKNGNGDRTVSASANGSANGSANVRNGRPGRGARPTAGAPSERDGFRILSDLEIDLGDRFRVFGSGVEARLAGAVTLSGELPNDPRLNGTVRVVQGTYTGFGQKLQIERGTLVFNGPVDNPAIDIVAYRRYLPVEAGVALTGTANTPRLDLVSRPDVPEADKLSWLVLGIGSETARTGGEAAALQAAAATVLAASDSPFARRGGLAGTFGLDVLSIRTEQAGASGAQGADSSTSAQDSIVTLGKRLSDRLFVSYEQSVRGVQNLLRLQYEITDRLSVRLKTGTDSSVDLLWTYRYD